MRRRMHAAARGGGQHRMRHGVRTHLGGRCAAAATWGLVPPSEGSQQQAAAWKYCSCCCRNTGPGTSAAAQEL